MNPPLITIGVTTFNAASTIRPALQSALAQTWRATEILAVDDASTDETIEILAQLAADTPAIRVLYNQKNEGVAFCRNRILAEARGSFVAFFDDDDESLPDRLERQLDRILVYEREFAGGASVMCHTARNIIYPNGNIRVEPTMGQEQNHRAPSGMALAERILLGTPLKHAYGTCPTCCQMARTRTYRDAGGFDPAFRRSEDTEFNVRAAKLGAHFAGIPRALVIQKMTKTSEKSLYEEHRYLLMLLEKHRDIAEKHGLYEFCRSWIHVRQAWLERCMSDFIYGCMNLASKYPLQTLRRMALAAPNIGQHRAFSRFHIRRGGRVG